MKKLIAVFACVMMLFGMTGCGSASSSSASVLNFTSELDIISMDSTKAEDGMSFDAIHAITDGLMGTDKDGKIVEKLSASYEVSDDGLTYTFTLKDAKWSNGDAVTAHDFVYAWRRIIQESGGYAYMIGSGGAGVKNADKLMDDQAAGKTLDDAAMEELGITAKDDKTLVIELENPCPYFLDLMTFPCYFPQNQKFVEEQGTSYATTAETTISNSAYKMTSWKKG